MPRIAVLLAVAGPLCLSAALRAEDREPSPAELARLAARLSDDKFAARQSAERQLTEIGRVRVAEALSAIEPPPEAPYGADRSAYFAGITERAQDHLRRRFYDHLPAAAELEGELRLQRIRRGLTARIDEHVLRLRAKYPVELSAEQRQRVEGYTGGFRGRQLWFDASYRNQSQYVITAARIRLRLEKQGEKFDHEILVGTSAKPIRPGDSGTWSAEVDLPRGASYALHWQTVAVFGFPLENSSR